MTRVHLTSRIPGLIVALSVASVAACATPPSALATFPGTPGPIVYAKGSSSEAGARGGLVAHGPRRSQRPHALTSYPEDEAPSYSADGRLIAFSGDREPLPASSGSHIYVMDANGGNVRQVTSGAGYDSNPSFSPNGSQIVFDRTVGSGSPRIFIVNLDGGGLQALTDGSTSDSDPVFTPNGRRIVYVSNGDSDGRTDRSDIFAMGSDGANQRVLIDGIRNETEPDVSPNGRRIVFVSTRDHGPNVFVARSNGSRVRAVTRSHRDCFSSACYLGPTWSPDGGHLAYLRVGRYSSELVVSRPDGSQSREFDSGGTEEEGYGTRIGPPAWGPVPR
jgi:Tol biopolymer transport system component